MLAGGGRTLEDLRALRDDEGLRALLLQLEEMPSSDATGDWLRRDRARRKAMALAGLQHVNRGVFRRLLRRDEAHDYTLDIDATQIVAEKREAHYTYKGEKGYMPMVGHIAELGLVVGHEFREGNTAPAARNLEFLQACERNMPKGAAPLGKKIVAVRADSAAYQAAIFNCCEETSKVFAIGADQDAAVKAAIDGHSRRRVEEIPRRRNRRDGPLHEQDQESFSVGGDAPSSGTGFVRGAIDPFAITPSPAIARTKTRRRRWSGIRNVATPARIGSRI